MEKRKKIIASLIYLIFSGVAIFVSYHKDENTIIFALILALSIILFLLSAANLAIILFHNEICDDIEDIEERCIETKIGEEYEEDILDLKESISVINLCSFVITVIIIILLIISFII